MQNRNKELVTKKEIQQGFKGVKGDIKELKQDIKELGIFMKQGFTALDQKIDTVERHLTDRMDRIESQNDRRLSIVEDRVRVVKNVIEKDLKTKVAW